MEESRIHDLNTITAIWISILLRVEQAKSGVNYFLSPYRRRDTQCPGQSIQAHVCNIQNRNIRILWFWNTKFWIKKNWLQHTWNNAHYEPLTLTLTLSPILNLTPECTDIDISTTIDCLVRMHSTHAMSLHRQLEQRELSLRRGRFSCSYSSCFHNPPSLTHRLLSSTRWGPC